MVKSIIEWVEQLLTIAYIRRNGQLPKHNIFSGYTVVYCLVVIPTQRYCNWGANHSLNPNHHLMFIAKSLPTPLAGEVERCTGAPSPQQLVHRFLRHCLDLFSLSILQFESCLKLKLLSGAFSRLIQAGALS